MGDEEGLTELFRRYRWSSGIVCPYHIMYHGYLYNRVEGRLGRGIHVYLAVRHSTIGHVLSSTIKAWDINPILTICRIGTSMLVERCYHTLFIEGAIKAASKDGLGCGGR